MAAERWGSLSVADHIDATDLAADVLLYDRLIIPVMADRADRSERAYWDAMHWQPDLQRRRIEQLAELAIRRPWNAARRAIFPTRLAELQAERFDVQHFDSQAMTRMILAPETVDEKIRGDRQVDIVAAYNSRRTLAADFLLENASADAAPPALLVTRRLALPDLRDPEEALRLACELSRDPVFRERRAAFFDWQLAVAARRLAVQAAVGQLCRLVDACNDVVQSATRQLRWKFACTVFGNGVRLAAGARPAAGDSASLTPIEFASLDHAPVIEPGRSTPVAMFHDDEVVVGVAPNQR